MEQSPSLEAYSHSAGQNISRIYGTKHFTMLGTAQ
jgi:hypothetical protein